jgi:hypothetical protein
MQNKHKNKPIVDSTQNGNETVTKIITPNIETGKSDAEILDILKALYANIPDFAWDDIKSDLLILIQNTRISFEQKLKDKRQKEIQASKQGRGSDKIPTAEIITVAEAEKRFVYLNVGQQVFDLDNPTNPPLPILGARNTYAASFFTYLDTTQRPKVKLVIDAWKDSPKRMTTEGITYRPEGGQITVNPHGLACVNTWRPRSKIEKPSNYEKHTNLFVDHVRWVFGDVAEVFLDWLAHIEQKPGELPHFGWVHISKQHGTGRNWIATVLGKVWLGNVALNFKLIETIEKGFNESLSRTHLAVIDEINEGGNSMWKHTSALRQLVTEDHRLINPKFGQLRTEYNTCRWLIFSNHTGALPLDEHDRRFWVVNKPLTPKEESVYQEMYRLISNQEFIDSVRFYLSNQDISKFNAGQRPPLNNAKLDLAMASKSEADFLAQGISKRWPVDILYLQDFKKQLPEDEQFTSRGIKHALDRVGISRWKKSEGKVRITQGNAIAYVIRNHDIWNNADAIDIKRENDRMTMIEKENATFGDAPPSEIVSSLKNVISIR